MITMESLLGKIVEVDFKEPAQSGSSRDTYPKTGRVVKVYKKESRFLMVNPECQTDADVSSSGPNGDVFKWGTWIDWEEVVIHIK